MQISCHAGTGAVHCHRRGTQPTATAFSVDDFFDQRHDVRLFPADAKLLWQLPS